MSLSEGKNTMRTVISILLRNRFWQIGSEYSTPTAPQRGATGWMHSGPNGRTYTATVDRDVLFALKVWAVGSAIGSGIVAAACTLINHGVR